MLKKTYLATAAVCAAIVFSYSAPVAASDVQEQLAAKPATPVSVRGNGMNDRFACLAAQNKAHRACEFGPPLSASACVCPPATGRSKCYVTVQCAN